jgi:hypothetical protein
VAGLEHTTLLLLLTMPRLLPLLLLLNMFNSSDDAT